MDNKIENKLNFLNKENALSTILLRIGIELYRNSKLLEEWQNLLDRVSLVQAYGEDWVSIIDDIWSFDFREIKEKLNSIEKEFKDTLSELLVVWMNAEENKITVNNLFDTFVWEEKENVFKEIWTFLLRNNNEIRKKLSDFFTLFYSDLPENEKTAEKRYSFEYELPKNLLYKLKEIWGENLFSSVFGAEKEILDKLWERCSYDYLSPLSSSNFFERTTWIDIKEVIWKSESMLLVWSWSGKTIEFLLNQGVLPEQITCIDISQEAIDYTTSQYWCVWYVWRIEDCSLNEEWYDYCFLEYFVDRDDNQRATFDQASILAKKKIILEWLFPVVSEDTSWTSYVTDKETLVTTWNSASEDMQKVAKYLESKMWELSEIRYSLGMRLVSTLWDWVEVLPSWTISLTRKQD